MIWLVTQMSMHWGTATKIKNNFDNAFRYDVFIVKAGKALNLPGGVDHLFEMRGLWYVNVAVQVSELLMMYNLTK
ncbi:MAG: hypothetical protein M3N30_05585 [Bacteroidota bacterium]|nr:hypothetical protein [Bacteroidota bacterium]